MLETTLWICAALALAFAINLVPAFMPSTWMVLAFFYIKFDLPLVILTVLGAIVSGFGRLVLAKATTRFKRRFMREQEGDLNDLGAFLDERRDKVAPAVFLYALTPFPTNNLFIAAGMVEVNIAWVLLGFWSARIIADTFWVWTTSLAFDNLGDIFETAVSGPTAIALQVAGVISIVLLFKLPWARWLRKRFGPSRPPERDERPAAPPPPA